MTEREWLDGIDPELLLQYLANRASERKLRLFACACVMRMPGHLSDERSRKAIEAAEKFADARTNAERSAIKSTRRDVRMAVSQEGVAYSSILASSVALYSLCRSAAESAIRISREVARAIPTKNNHELHAERVAQTDLLRCVFGNPFQSAKIVTRWIAWNNRTVCRLAEEIYQKKDFDCLPILADALEDAGCDKADILLHCRGPGPHVRGCWVVDLLLCKT